MPTRIDTAIPTRASLVIANLMRADPMAAVRGALSPDTLTPTEHADIVDSLFGEGESWGKSAARFLTNPLTLIGLALAVKFPAPSLLELAPTAKSLANYDTWIPRVMGWATDLFQRFHNTGIDDAFLAMSREKNGYFEKYAVPGLGKGLDEFAAATGALPTPTQNIKMGWNWAMQAEGDQMRGYLNKLIATRAKLTGLNDIAPLAPEALAAAPLSQEEASLVSRVKQYTTDPQYATLVEADANGSLPELHDMLAKRRSTWNTGAITAKRGQLPPRIADRFPGILLRDDEADRAIFNQTTAEYLNPKVAAQMNAQAAASQTTGAAAFREGKTIPSAKQARMLADAGLLPESTAQTIEKLTSFYADPINQQSPLAQRDFHMSNVVASSTDAMARAYAWTVKRDWLYEDGLGNYLKDRIDEMMASGDRGRRDAMILANHYIPAALGRSTPERFIRGLDQAATSEWTLSMLDKPEIADTFGPKLTQQLKEMAQYGPMAQTTESIGAKVASYLYLSTAGFNPAMAMNRLFHTLLTTSGIVKPQYLLRGLSEGFKGVSEVIKLESEGMLESEAIKQVWPDFHAQGLGGAPAYSDVIRSARGAAAGITTDIAKSTMEKFADKAMLLFDKSGLLNDYAAFRGAQLQSLAEGASEEVAPQIGAKVTKLASQWTGPFGRALGVDKLNQTFGTWAGQYMNFPVKLASYAGLSLAGGAGVGPGGVFNPGTIGRAVVGTMAAYEAGHALFGADLGHAMLFGALPGPEARGPFAPWPLVPPAVGAAGAIGMDIATGRFEQTPRVLSLFVPGGLEAGRLLPLLGSAVGADEVAQPVAQALSKPYAAWDQQGPDGLVPVYGQDGQLLNRMSPWSIVSRAAGLPTGEFQQDQNLRSYLARQRDEIRGYRRNYIQALTENDTTTMEGINQEFQQRFGIGDIQVKKSDIMAYQSRQAASQAQRLMQQLPAAARPLYSGIVSGAMSNVGPELLGTDADYFAPSPAYGMAA